MTMTDKDICLEYRQAKDKDAQIGILADLNQCSEGQIADILRRGGEQIETPSNDQEELRERVRQTPKKYGLSRSQFCKEYGLNCGTLRSFINGGSNVSAGMADRIAAALDKLESGKEPPVKTKPVKAATPAPNQPGVTLTKAEAGVLVEYLEESIYGYTMNSLASSEPRECLYKLYELFGAYKRLKEVGE